MSIVYRFTPHALLLAAASTLAACGFHLAGTHPLPAELQPVYIDVIAPYRVSEPPVETALRTKLQGRGVKVTGNLNSAHSILRLSNLQETRRVLSIGPDGKALEYELTTRVHYEFISGDKVLLPADVINVVRDYSFNAQQVLAKEAEETRLQAYMQGELAELLLLRIETVVAAVVAPAAPATSNPQAAPPAN